MEFRNERQIIGDSTAIRRVLQTVATAAPDARDGAARRARSGTGKELFARAIHDAERPPRRAVHQAQLRRAPRGAGRERAVRPREGRVHRRDQAGGRRVRAGATAARCCSTRSARCGSTCRPSCCACCRSRSSSASADRRPIKVDVRIIATTNRDLAADAAAGTLPAGSLLSAERHSGPAPAAARAAGGHPAAGVPLRDAHYAAGDRQGDQRASRPRRSSCCSATTGRATSASCSTRWSGR